MLRSLGVLSALLAAIVSVDGAHIHVKVFNEKATTTTTSTSSTDGSATVGTVAPADTSSSSSDGYHMTTITSVQARVQGDAPVWDETNKIWVSKYGSTVEEQYANVLDTVNTASVEGALMYVQAEGINVNEQSVKCQRKNNMQYVVFYELSIVQPTYSIAYYGKDGYTIEYCPFVAMDGAKCTDSGDDLPQACKQYNGLDGELDLGPCVGANLQDSDPRAPYPGNYWFSFPSSCVMELRADKTDECREKYPGGLCALGVEPDGVNCTFSYKILGYSNIDDIVGITSMTDSLGNYYTNYTEFCEDGGVEFSATNTGNGFEVTESIDFWVNPGDETANTGRFESMVKQYNANVGNSSTGTMTALPSIETLNKANPACYLNSPVCAEAELGCKRTLYAQICEVCNETSSDCVTAPSGFTFPTLSLPSVSSSSSDSTSDSTSGSTEAGTSSADTLSDDSSAVMHASTISAAFMAALVGVMML